MKNFSILILFAILSFSKVLSQQYTMVDFSTAVSFSQNSSATTIFSSNTDDEISSSINIGFSFKFGCNYYESLKVSSNGFVVFGGDNISSLPTNGWVNSSSVPMIAPLWDDLMVGSTGNINYSLTGASPNRVLTIEWKNMKWNKSATSNTITFQLIMYEGSNKINFHYRNEIGGVSSASATIGFATSTNNSNFYSLNSTSSPSLNNGISTNNIAVKPGNNRLLVFNLIPKSIISATSSNLSPSPLVCSNLLPMVRLDLNVQNPCSELNLSSCTIDMTGTTPSSVVSRVHLYYTGNSAVFSDQNELIIGGLVPAPSLTFSGFDQQLVSGNNYFWISYDMNNTGVVGQPIGAQFSSTIPIILGGQNQSLASYPNGSGNFSACSTYPSFTTWFKANSGVVLNSGKVSNWTTAGTSISFSLAQPNASYRPTLIQGSVLPKNFNYNPRVDFDSTRLTSLFNTSTSSNVLGTNGTVFMCLEKGKPVSGTIFSYSNPNFNSGAKYYFDPNNTMVSANTISSVNKGANFDSYSISNPSYSNYFPSDFSSKSAFINTSIGMNTNMKIRINSIQNDTPTSVNSTSIYPSGSKILGNGLTIGSTFDGTFSLPSSSDVAEILTMSSSPTSIQINMVESYLALKYGITLGNNNNTSTNYNYFNSSGSVIFDKALNVGFTNDIAGIGKDNGSSLFQKQSISVNISEPVTIGVGSIAASNQLNTNDLLSVNSFLIWGNNGQVTKSVMSNPLSFLNLPSSIFSRILRIWKVQNTNLTNSVTVGFETSLLTNYLPISRLRLLVDEDGVDWTNATIYTGAILNNGRVEFSNVTLDNTKPFFTLATTDTGTPLSVALLSFDVKTSNCQNIISWTIGNETNSEFYYLEKSIDGKKWETISLQNSSKLDHSQIEYTFVDKDVLTDICYYRLNEVDVNGNKSLGNIISSKNECENNRFIFYPNPASSIINIESYDSGLVSILSSNGKIINQFVIDKGINQLQIDSLPLGFYIFEITFNNGLNEHISFIKN